MLKQVPSARMSLLGSPQQMFHKFQGLILRVFASLVSRVQVSKGRDVTKLHRWSMPRNTAAAALTAPFLLFLLLLILFLFPQHSLSFLHKSHSSSLYEWSHTISSKELQKQPLQNHLGKPKSKAKNRSVVPGFFTLVATKPVQGLGRTALLNNAAGQGCSDPNLVGWRPSLLPLLFGGKEKNKGVSIRQ